MGDWVLDYNQGRLLAAFKEEVEPLMAADPDNPAIAQLIETKIRTAPTEEARSIYRKFQTSWNNRAQAADD